MNNVYDEFALFYDKFGVSDYSIRLGKGFLQYLAEKYPDECIARHLDVCCGTGLLCDFMKKQGIATFGYDLSEEMIKKARSNYPDIEFYVADATKYTDNKIYDFATCTDDALNHLTDPSMLKAVFRTTANVLRKGGFFFFDLNDINCEELYNEQPYAKGVAGDEKMIYQIFRPSKDKLRGNLKHVKSGRVDWEGNIYERLYEKEDVERYLQEAGLTLIECRKDFYEATRPIKNVFIARK